jgi:antitoxin Phd
VARDALTLQAKMTSYKTSLKGCDDENLASSRCKGAVQRTAGRLHEERPAAGHQTRVDAAVLVPVQEWKRLSNHARPTLKQLLLSNEARADFALPPRGKRQRRAPQVLA